VQNPQPARVVRSRNPRRYGILSLSWALGSDRCGKGVADGMGELRNRLRLPLEALTDHLALREV
jgi:hypothetical protein